MGTTTNLQQQLDASEPSLGDSNSKPMLDNIRFKKSELTSKQKSAGKIDGLYPVIIDKSLVVFIKDPSREQEVFEKYYKHIYGRLPAEELFTFIDDKQQADDTEDDE